MLINIYKAGVKRMGSVFFQWWPVIGQRPMDQTRIQEVPPKRKLVILRVMENWNRLTLQAVESPSLENFWTDPVQPALEEYALAGGWTRRSPEVHSNPYFSASLIICKLLFRFTIQLHLLVNLY